MEDISDDDAFMAATLALENDIRGVKEDDDVIMVDTLANDIGSVMEDDDALLAATIDLECEYICRNTISDIENIVFHQQVPLRENTANTVSTFCNLNCTIIFVSSFTLICNTNNSYL